MKDGKCTKGYPKEYRNTTEEDQDGYPLYRRRPPGDKGEFTFKWKDNTGKEHTLGNEWVVPHNPPLLLYLGWAKNADFFNHNTINNKASFI